jgi:hypothetical protein
MEPVKIVSVSPGVLLDFEVDWRRFNLKPRRDFMLSASCLSALVYFIFIDGKKTGFAFASVRFSSRCRSL